MTFEDDKAIYEEYLPISYYLKYWYYLKQWFLCKTIGQINIW